MSDPKAKPVFEIYAGKRHYKIYLNGRVEGMRGAKVINRIPEFLERLTEALADEHREIAQNVKRKMGLE